MIDFNKVLDELKPNLTIELYESIISIIEIKKQANELDLKPRIECVDKWIEHVIFNTDDELKLLQKSDPTEKPSFDEYDDLLHSILNVKFEN